MTQNTHASGNGSPDPRREATPTFVETVVRADVTQHAADATPRIERSKNGRGALIALFVVPILVVAVVIVAYWLFAVFRTNAEQERTIRPHESVTTTPAARP
jgi:hypothetical protein